MSEQQRILDIYAAISAKTSEMLDAARANDWDGLVELEHECRALVEQLKRTERDPGASARFVQSKIAYIRKVLADDAEIRKLTEPWMVQLERYIGSARQARKLQRAYESGPRG